MRVGLQKITSHRFLPKMRQVNEVVEEIDLQGLSDDYWSSTRHEFIIPSQS